MQAIKIDDLSKVYKDVIAVNHLSLEVEENELFSLLGVNGAGKTTTIKVLSGLTEPTTGNATIFGHSVKTEIDKVKEIVSLSTQETSIAKKLTVKENLLFFGSLYHIEKKELEKRIAYLVEKFGLEKFLTKKAGKLSGGYMRKVSVAMALISKPKILFLDEPTLGLDVLARHELWDIIQDIKKDTTVILTTHYLEEAEYLSDRIGIMVGGKLVALGTCDELKQRTSETNFENAFIKIVKEVKE